MTAVAAPEERPPYDGGDEERPARATRGAGDAPDAGDRARPTRSKLRKRLTGVAILLGLGAAISSPWWARPALSRLAYFRVRRVEFDGVRYAPVSELVARLRIDTTTSVWADPEPLARRVRAHPLVSDARVERRLPGTLHVVVTEKVPVALSPVREGFAVYDSAGHPLPIDPSRVGGVDAPVIAGRDTTLLRLLAELRAAAPRLFARVSEARRVVRSTGSGGAGGSAGGRDEIELSMAVAPALVGREPGQPGASPRPTLVVRAMSDVSAARLADLLPVESDLARRRARVAEIDLRFRDQVIARLQ